MRDKILEHRFVESFPDVLAPGVLYVSVEYGSVAHSCCCGCGEEVVTPLTPTDWNITYDGESVTLNPSVGSWTLKCRSHYVIRRNRVIEASPWSDAQVAAERRRDRAAKTAHYAPNAPAEFKAAEPVPMAGEPKDREARASWTVRFLDWLRRLMP